MKIFIDEYRTPEQKYIDHTDWTPIKNCNDFVQMMDRLINEKKWIDSVSFDYQTNNYQISLNCFSYLIKTCILKDLKMPNINIHSDVLNIEGIFKSVGSRYEQIMNKKIIINTI